MSSDPTQASLFHSDRGTGSQSDEIHIPLAARLRPRTLDDYAGQEHIIGPGRMLRRAIEQDQTGSFILWGPPGSGKTTLAEIVARLTQAHFSAVSAVSAGVADLRKIIDEARMRLKATRQRTILFIDEIHRFNKAQQDAVLPHVEQGTVILIGATTENPSFEVNAALLSRCRVYTLHALTDDQIRLILERALADTVHGLGDLEVEIESEALTHLVTFAGGDARTALNALELAALAVQNPGGNTSTGQRQVQKRRLITLADVEDALQQRALLYDKSGEQHYDSISALIKSVRASDPDAAIYYLARILQSGEDPLFVARRLVILAAEDIGLADPQALSVAVAAQQAAHFVGMPEALLPLAEATLYLACAPKSNSALKAYWAAVADIEQYGSQPIPLHLRNAPTGLMKGLGYGKGYHYAHDFIQQQPGDDPNRPPAQKGQQCLPDALKDHHYYEPTGFGHEATTREWIDKRRLET